MKKLILMLMLIAPLSVFAQKFGHINSQEIMAQMPEFIKARGDIEAQAKQYENDLKSMQDELTRKSDEYEKGKSTMNATAQQQKEQELQQLYQKIQQAYQDRVEEYEHIKDIVGNIDENGYYNVYSDGELIIYGEGDDIVIVR